MKLTIDGLDLSEAVGIVSRAANSKTNPILEGIKLIAKGDTLVLQATDLDLYIQKTIRADIKKEGTVIVPGKLFADYVRKLDKSQISLTSDGESIIINHDDNESKFQCLLADEYPEIISLKSDPHFTIAPDAFIDLVSKTTICASTDDSRPVLRGVLFEIADEKLTGVALDGFRLAKVEKTIENHKGDSKVIIPARSLDEVKKLITGTTEEISIIIENKFFQVAIGGTVFASRLVEGDFINYAQILPKSFNSEAVVERTEFERAVERAGLLVRGDKINLVTLKIADKQTIVASHNEIGKVNEKVATSLSGKDINISFNAKYLFDALKNMQNEFIKISLTTEHSPSILTGAKDGDFLFLILPVRMAS